MPKDILIALPEDPKKAARLAEAAVKAGIKGFVSLEDHLPRSLRKGTQLYSPSGSADFLVVSEEQLDANPPRSRAFAVRISVTQPGDIQNVIRAVRAGAAAIIVETPDWKIIPLENILAESGKADTRILAQASGVDEVETMFGILERGVSGVVLHVKDEAEIRRASQLIKSLESIELVAGEVTQVLDIGMGERVCVDTTSMLTGGQGTLVGSTSNFFFLVHNEAVAAKFTAPRPFRINAGAVHSYILLPNSKTKYLSEIEAGDKILIVDAKGSPSIASVGRAKIERRPLVLIKAGASQQKGNVIVQNAETIRLVSPQGEAVSVTEIRPGSRVLVHVAPPTGRHFGTRIDEFIVEK